MIDSHCHLNDIAYDNDREEVIESAVADGIEYIVVPATKPSDLDFTLSLAMQYEQVYSAVGVHPHDASSVDAVVLSRIKELAGNRKVVAIGEIGLDYYYNYSSREEQIFAFEEQIKLAQDLSLPIIVHNRESDADILTILTKYYNNRLSVSPHRIGVFHCFSSNKEMLNKVLELGFDISFTANITFAKTDLDDVVLHTPLEKLLLETDSPYMAPPPNRGKRNIPQSVRVVAEKISQIKNISIETIMKMTTENAKMLFKIPVILVLFAFAFVAMSLVTASFGQINLLAQTNSSSQNIDSDSDSDYDEEEDVDETDPYVRRLGFGPLFGTNTFVDRYTTGSKSFSQEGLFSAGGLINYRILEGLIVQFAYTYAENHKIVDRLPDSTKDWIDPNYHNAIELNFIGMLIPKKMVNFYGSLGATYFMNHLSKNIKVDGVKRKFYDDDDQIGINMGVGAFINISLGKAGVLVFTAEWKLSFRIDETHLNYDPRLSPDNENYEVPTSYTSMSSVPRGGIIWYMPFLK